MRHWVAKFRYAGQGILHALQSHSSFAVHVPVAGLVILFAVWLQLEAWRWAALILCIGMVLALELVNTSIEMLDLAAAAVLAAAITAVIVGLIVLLPPLWATLQR